MTTPFAIGDELLAQQLNDLKMTFTSQVFTATGTWIKPDGCSRVLVRVIGSGGAGGGAATTGAATAAAGGGGGAGGYAEKLFLASALANTETVDIGAGGAAAAAGANNGGNGGACTFATGKAYVVTANGGFGGVGMPAVAAGQVLGGVGGTATGGDINEQGSAGNAGFIIATAIALPTNHGGWSHHSPMAESPATNSAGTAGKPYGGGSSGAMNGVSQSQRASTAGATGLVIVWNCF